MIDFVLKQALARVDGLRVCPMKEKFIGSKHQATKKGERGGAGQVEELKSGYRYLCTLPEAMGAHYSTRLMPLHKPVMYHDVVIRQNDYDTLANDCWLNDTIIDFHMEYLEREKIPSDMRFKILLLRPGMVELIVHVQDPSHLSAALPKNLHKADAIFIPVNDSRPLVAYSGSHWSLMVYLRAYNTFYYYDSMGTANIQEAQFTCERLIPLLGIHQQAAIQAVPTPQQTNSADCGIYVIAITDNLVQRLIETQARVAPDRLMRVDRNDIKVKSIRKTLRRLIKELPPIK